MEVLREQSALKSPKVLGQRIAHSQWTVLGQKAGLDPTLNAIDRRRRTCPVESCAGFNPHTHDIPTRPSLLIYIYICLCLSHKNIYMYLSKFSLHVFLTAQLLLGCIATFSPLAAVHLKNHVGY